MDRLVVLSDPSYKMGAEEQSVDVSLPLSREYDVTAQMLGHTLLDLTLQSDMASH